jgi:hypothetical protein
MFETECRLYEFLGVYADELMRDVDDARMAERPAPGMNHPAWIVGHLAVVARHGSTLLGWPAAGPEGWSKLFGPGSEAAGERGAYPPKDELMAAYRESRGAFLAAAREADPAAMGRPHGIEIAFLKEAFPTNGVLIAHLLTTHEAVHLGQLSAWRRGMGMEGVLRI